MIWTFLAATRFQLRLFALDRKQLTPLATAPLSAVIFLAIIRHADRPDLTSHALVAPVLIALWSMALFISAEMIDADRASGVLEALLATSANYAVLIFGRIFTVTTVSLVAFAEVWVVGYLFFGVPFRIHHPFIFVLTLSVTTFSIAATAMLMAGAFVLGRAVLVFQSSLSYPFYILGGVIVPVSLLPDWTQPLARIVFLSWSSDLLRDSLELAPVLNAPLRLGMVAALGVGTFLIGLALLSRMLTQARSKGSFSLM